MECIFCKIVKKQIPSFPIYEDDKFLVVLDIAPASKGQFIVIPKNHYESIFDVDEETIRGMLLVAVKVGKVVKEIFGAKGFHFVINDGQIAGQTVPHIALWGIPRYGNEQVVVGWARSQANPEELEKIMNQIIASMGKKEVKIEKKKEEKKMEGVIKIKYLMHLVKKK